MGPAGALLCLNYAKTPAIAATLLTAALSLSSFSQAGFMLNIQVSSTHRIFMYPKIQKIYIFNTYFQMKLKISY